ncbi:reverse transcriptase domain-containing protein, partial [Tanacetum coccineum]
MVLDEEKKIEGYIWGLLDSIQGNSKQGNNRVQQTPPKRQNVARAYTARPREKKVYAGTLPFCNKYKLHHTGSCTVKCGNYKRVGYMTRDCRTHVPATTLGAPFVNQKVAVTCYECGKQGYYRSECLKLKNQNRGNKVGNGEAWEEHMCNISYL